MPGLTITVLVAGHAVPAEIPPESLEVLREALAVPAAPARPPSRFVNVAEAQEILRCPRRRRIYELVGDGRLTRQQAKPLLLLRSEVEALAAGEVTPR